MSCEGIENCELFSVCVVDDRPVEVEGERDKLLTRPPSNASTLFIGMSVDT